MKEELKPIKKIIVEKNDIFKTIKRIYPHLSGYSHKEILSYYQVTTIKELETHIEHIKTKLYNKTENYQKELEGIDNCFCTDANGCFKNLYPSENNALQTIERIYKEQQIKLIAYPCPYHCGWHLTKV